MFGKKGREASKKKQNNSKRCNAEASNESMSASCKSGSNSKKSTKTTKSCK